MHQRRQILAGLACTAAAAALGSKRSLGGYSVLSQTRFKSVRPAPAERRFVSEAVEAKIIEVKRAIADPELGWLFENCFPNTLDTTVTFGTRDQRPDTFVITGDIKAMWLRDSTAQITPYLPLARTDKKLNDLIAGVINRQTLCILIDRYANAFDFGAKACPWGVNDKPPLKPELCERKWEIDSLCYPVRLAHAYWKTTGDTSCFHSDWRQASSLIVKTFREQQRLHGPGPYSFQRTTNNPIDTPPFEGRGNPTRPRGTHSLGLSPLGRCLPLPLLDSCESLCSGGPQATGGNFLAGAGGQVFCRRVPGAGTRSNSSTLQIRHGPACQTRNGLCL